MATVKENDIKEKAEELLISKLYKAGMLTEYLSESSAYRTIECLIVDLINGSRDEFYDNRDAVIDALLTDNKGFTDEATSIIEQEESERYNDDSDYRREVEQMAA